MISSLRRASPAWRYGAYVLAALTLVPIVVVLASWLQPVEDHWLHIREHLLGRLVLNSLTLVVGVLAGSFVLGVSLAWITAFCRFPGRDFFKWALLAPFAIPAYVVGFVYTGLFEYSGPVQTMAREWFSWWPSSWGIGQYPGVVMVMSLTLFPYVYFVVRGAFVSNGSRTLEAARSLGQGQRAVLVRLALPMARPWVLSSLALVGMETLADFGTVSVFGYETFTTAIYKSWYGFFSPNTAAQLSSLLVVFVAVLFLIEQSVGQERRYTANQNGDPYLIQLKGWRLWMVLVYCSSVFLVGFVVPILQLLVWAWEVLGEELTGRILAITINSIIIGSLTALSVSVIALFLVLASRFWPDGKVMLAAKLATLGYALPGSVLAVGVFVPFVWFDKNLVAFLVGAFGGEPSLWLTGSIFTMVVGLTVRFLAVGYSPLSGQMERVSPRLDEAAMNYGYYGLQMARKLHIPLVRRGIIIGAILVFVDVVKEMPLTLMSRPFGWDTLSVRIFEMVSEGEWERASVPAVFLVLTGLISVFFLTKQMRD